MEAAIVVRRGMSPLRGFWYCCDDFQWLAPLAKLCRPCRGLSHPPRRLRSKSAAIMTITTTYLEMFAHSHRDVPGPAARISVIHSRHPTIAWYRFLYDAVG